MSLFDLDYLGKGIWSYELQWKVMKEVTYDLLSPAAELAKLLRRGSHVSEAL